MVTPGRSSYLPSSCIPLGPAGLLLYRAQRLPSLEGLGDDLHDALGRVTVAEWIRCVGHRLIVRFIREQSRRVVHDAGTLRSDEKPRACFDNFGPLRHVT